MIPTRVQSVVDQIIANYKPQKIILFGSFAWGKPGPDSDIDLFVLKETENPWEMIGEIRWSLWDYPIPMDILVYNRALLKKSFQKQNLFIEDIIKNGKVLYER